MISGSNIILGGGKCVSSNRTRNSVVNIFVIVLMQVMNLIFSLVTKKLFLDVFSISAYGVVDLFNSFFSSLMLLELGFGTILIYNLYKPVALKNDEEIRNQLSVFKTIYFYLIIVIVGISLIFSPFLYKVFNITYQDVILVYLIYFSNVIHIIIKYLTLDKISILNANQEKYIENIIMLIVESINFMIKIIAVTVFKNIYIYMFSLLVLPSMTYLLEALWIEKHYNVKGIKLVSYKFIKESGALSQCRKYIYATIYSLVFFSMDNMIISIMLSTDSVAYVTNYNALLATGSQFVSMVMVSLRGIMADYRYKQKSKDGFFDIFNIVSSFNFIIVSLMTVGFFVLLDDFIFLWLGKEFIINKNILVALLMIRTLECIFEPINSIFIIEGYIFKEKISLIISAFANLFLTIILIKYIGLVGAYLATIAALLVKWFGKFYYVLKGVFKTHKNEVLRRYFTFLCLIISEMIIVNNFANKFIPDVISVQLFVYKFIYVVLMVLLVNCSIVLMNKSVRNYIANTLLNKTK